MSYDSSSLSAGYHGDTGVMTDLLSRLRLTDEQASRLLLVSTHTIRRWRCDRTPSKTAVRLLAILAGYVPWKGWKDWEVQEGYLFPPGYNKNGVLPQEFYAIIYHRQLARDYRRKVQELEEEKAQLQGRLEALGAAEPRGPGRPRVHRRRVS